MNYTIRGDQLSVHTDREADTVTVRNNATAEPLLTITTGQADELASLLARALRLEATNPPTAPVHPFLRA
jgi:hypothetical protein